MSEDQSAVARVAPALTGIDGVVKWFDPRKGFGFVTGPNGQDIFIHFSVIEQADGFRTLRDGERIVYSAACGAKGWAATHVRAAGSRAGAGPQGTDAATQPDSVGAAKGDSGRNGTTSATGDSGPSSATGRTPPTSSNGKAR